MLLLVVGLRNALVLLQCVGYLLWSTLDRTAYPKFFRAHTALVNEAIIHGLVLGRPTGLGYSYAGAHIVLPS